MNEQSSVNQSDDVMASVAFAEGSKWLVREAHLLDTQQYNEWFSHVSKSLTYEMPVRYSAYKFDGDGVSDGNAHFSESWGSMQVRVERMYAATAWAEDPPSRTRRLVTNIELVETQPDRMKLRSYLLLLRNRLDVSDYELLSAERTDVLVREDGDLKLAERWILPDQSVLGTVNLAVIL